MSMLTKHQNWNLTFLIAAICFTFCFSMTQMVGCNREWANVRVNPESGTMYFPVPESTQSRLVIEHLEARSK